MIGDFPYYAHPIQQGWQCPCCFRVYSPTTMMCFSCGNNTIKSGSGIPPGYRPWDNYITANNVFPANATFTTCGVDASAANTFLLNEESVTLDMAKSCKVDEGTEKVEFKTGTFSANVGNTNWI